MVGSFPILGRVTGSGATEDRGFQDVEDRDAAYSAALAGGLNRATRVAPGEKVWAQETAIGPVVNRNKGARSGGCPTYLPNQASTPLSPAGAPPCCPPGSFSPRSPSRPAVSSRSPRQAQAG